MINLLHSRRKVHRQEIMSVDVETSSLVYNGNGSSVTAYPVTFPYIDPEDVWVEVTRQGEEEGELLDRADFDVTGMGVVTTAAAYAGGDTVRVFRHMKFHQNAKYPSSGTFSPAEHERALDALCMLIQQVRRDFLGGGESAAGDAAQDVMTWANSSGRTTATPGRKGRLGVQLSDLSLWVAGSANTGDWNPMVTGAAETASRLRVGYIADCGQAGGEQTLVAATLGAMAAEWVLDAGDTSHGGGYPLDRTAFGNWITPGKYLRARGSRSLNTPADIDADANLFGYLSTSPYWYSKALGNGLVEIFALDTGRRSDGSFLLPGYCSIGSAQHSWFASAIKASTARHKIVLLHDPPVTSSADEADACPELDWPELSRADAILAGRAHLSEWMNWRGTPVINLSGAARPDRDSDYVSKGAPGGEVIWVNDSEPLIGGLWVTPGDVIVEAVNAVTGRVEFARSIYEKSDRPAEVAGWPWREGEALGGRRFLAVPGHAMTVNSVQFSFLTDGPTWRARLTADGAPVTPWVECAGVKRVSSGDVLLPLLRPATALRVETEAPEGYAGAPEGLHCQITGDRLS